MTVSSKICEACKAVNAIDVKYCSICGGANFELAKAESATDSSFESSPALNSAVDSQPHVNQRSLLILTIDHVPGREIAEVIGTVAGQGDAWFNTTFMRIEDARKKAMQDIRLKALAVEADAIIGLSINTAGVRGFWGIGALGQSAVVQVIGTAVKLK